MKAFDRLEETGSDARASGSGGEGPSSESARSGDSDGTPSPAPAPRASAPSGLFGFEGQAVASRLPPLRILFMLGFNLLAYAVAMTANGAASRLVAPRFLVPAGAPATSNLALVTRVFDPGALIAGLRCALMLALAGALALARELPPGGAAAAWALPASPKGLFMPIFVGATNSLGFLPYMLLASVSGVALWAALIALYVVGPVAYGIVARGESRAPRKLAGIALSVAAAVLIALPSGGAAAESVVAGSGPTGDEGLPGWARLLLYLLSAGIWGVSDTCIAYVGRETHVLHVTVLMSVGYGVTALACSACSYVLVANAGGGQLFSAAAAAAAAAASAAATAAANGTVTAGAAPDPYAAGSSSGGGWGYAILLLAQSCGALGIYTSAKIGQTSEASAFLPVLCLYTLPVSVFSVAFLGETLSAAGWVGVVIGAVGTVLIASA